MQVVGAAGGAVIASSMYISLFFLCGESVLSYASIYVSKFRVKQNIYADIKTDRAFYFILLIASLVMYCWK